MVFLIAWFNNGILGKSGQIVNAIIAKINLYCIVVYTHVYVCESINCTQFAISRNRPVVYCFTDLDEDVQATNFESGRPTSLRDVRYEEACNRLAVEAVKRGCTDNVTVMIVDISQPACTKDSQETAVKESS